jgi:L-amino acid N-acyltransferase YncA
LVQVEAGAVVGYAYASPHRDRAAYRWSVDVTVYVHRAHHRRGIGRRLYETLFPLLVFQGFCTAHAGITLPNPGSVGLHEGLGFEPIGVYPAVGWKLGAWHDVGWWRRPLGPRLPTPADPLPLAEARRLPAWPDHLR